jgi:hypothetical protein
VAGTWRYADLFINCLLSTNIVGVGVEHVEISDLTLFLSSINSVEEHLLQGME